MRREEADLLKKILEMTIAAGELKAENEMLKRENEFLRNLVTGKGEQ